MASPTIMAKRVGERRVYPLRLSLLTQKLRRLNKKLSEREVTWELLFNCLIDQEDFVEKTEWIKNYYLYIIWQENSNECLLIDSGSDPEKFINATDPYRFQSQSIINNHSHIAHIGAISDLQLIYAIPFYHHENKKR